MKTITSAIIALLLVVILAATVSAQSSTTLGRWVQSQPVAVRQTICTNCQRDTITVYDLPACNVCGVGFTPAEWEDRHEGHEPDCPRRDDPDSDEVCECDLVYHAHCCPDCAGDDE